MLYTRLNYALAHIWYVDCNTVAQQKLEWRSVRGEVETRSPLSEAIEAPITTDDNLMRFWQRNFRRWWLSLASVFRCRSSGLFKKKSHFVSIIAARIRTWLGKGKTSMKARNFASTSVHISELKGSRRGIDLARGAVLRPRFSTLFPRRRLLLHHRQRPFTCNVDFFFFIFHMCNMRV